MIYVHWIFIVVYAIVIISIIVTVLLDNRQPAKTMAWVMVLMFVPVFGIVLYIFFGQNTRKMRLMSQRSLDQLSKRQMLEFVEQRELRLPERYRSLIQLFTNQSLALPFKDNDVEFYTDGYQFFPALLQAIGRARQHIHLDVYIFADDPLGRLVSDALIQKAREGIEVRVIYDDVGCWRVPHKFFERMRSAGIDVCVFMPVKFPAFTSKVNYRNHRKLCIIDGVEGFTGGMNIAMRYVKGIRGGSLHSVCIAACILGRLVFCRPHACNQSLLLSTNAMAYRQQLYCAAGYKQSGGSMARHHAGICAHTA